jgi:hypothetical protein
MLNTCCEDRGAPIVIAFGPSFIDSYHRERAFWLIVF